MTLVGFLPTTDAQRARNFYVDILKLEFIRDDHFAIVLKSGDNLIRIARVKDFTPAPYTILGWEVADIHASVHQFAAAGVTFSRYPFLEQDPSGIWTAPDGSKVAWFTDPDGNVLSLSQH